MSGVVLVFVEWREGRIKRPVLECLGAARKMADVRGIDVCALALGPGAAGLAGELGRNGADRLIAAEAPFLELYAAQAYAACLAAAAEEEQASLVLLPATAMGRDLAARTAARLGTVCGSDMTEIALEDGGALCGTRPVYSGKALARIRITDARPPMATLRPNAFPAPAGDDTRPCPVSSLECPLSEEQLGERTVRLEQPEQQELDVAEASIVVSGGRGLKAAENFSVVRELAQALGGAVGASRAVVDAGWIPHAHQVGQTGKVVSPALYVACGISGAIQHLAGMATSGVIVAINKDADAPIFKVADYGIVGDLFEVVPALTAAVRQHEG